jgi:hypothetical protein
MEETNFHSLLLKHGITFHWHAVDRKWWLEGRVNHGCEHTSKHFQADSFHSAQTAAVEYIQNRLESIQ